MKPTLEMILSEVSYDKETGSFIRVAATRYRPIGSDASLKSGSKYVWIRINKRNYYAHHLAWFIEYGEWPSIGIDHINGLPSDNRIANLRLASVRQNAYNKKIMSNNKSGIKGVSFDAKRNKWCAYICIEGKQTMIGRFPGKEQAADAYRAAAIKHFGEYARL